VRLASDGEMRLAMSRPVMLWGNSRLAPSGKVRTIFIWGSAGFKFARPNWNPDAGALLSGIGVSLSSLLRTSAGKRDAAVYSRGFGACNRAISRKSASRSTLEEWAAAPQANNATSEDALPVSAIPRLDR